MYKQRQTTVSDTDVQLIREFSLRPIIYDKQTPYFKNKYLTDSAWDEIAAKVGADGERQFFFFRFSLHVYESALARCIVPVNVSLVAFL